MKLFRAFFLLFPLIIQAGEINVTSYNIRFAGGDKGERDWSVRKVGVGEFVEKGDFDFIGLQEALEVQLKDLQAKLPKHSLFGVGRDDGKTKGEYSPIFYQKEKWKIDENEKGTFWLSDTPEKIASKHWGNNIPRICTWARFVDQEGKGIYVFNTHFDHQSQQSREKAAELVLKKIGERKSKEESVILMGDFNATTENKAIKTFLTSSKLVDHSKGEQKKTFSGWRTGLVKGLRIDHIFTSPDLKEGKFEVVADGDPPNSDHHPVTLKIELP